MADIITISTSNKSSLINDHIENDIDQHFNGQKIQQKNEKNNYKQQQQQQLQNNNLIETSIITEIDNDNDDDVDDDDYGIDKTSAISNTVEIPQHLTKFFQNKLKRKKKLSVSLTSVSDLVNQEKRTRIEGIQLNCRGKLQLSLVNDQQQKQQQINSISEALTQTNHHSHHHNCLGSGMHKMEKVITKPPIPPSRTERTLAHQHQQQQQQYHQHQLQQNGMKKVPPPRLKRKLEENVSIIQKLNALTEQMRLEISELKQNLNSEKGAVRVLRAQNESETRKWKNEVKKLQSTLEVLRKMSTNNTPITTICNNNLKKVNELNDGTIIITSDATTISNNQLQKLTNEVNVLKESNRMLEDKKQINSDANRRKAADIRELKDSYEIRLTQLSKSAKNEISRLLEEIKTKERNIGQLKRELQMLQNKTISKNATRNNSSAVVTAVVALATTTTTTTTTTSVMTTNSNTTQKNPAPIRANRANRRKDSRNVQHPNEVKKLKDFERNNTTNKNINNNNNNNLNNTKFNGKGNIHLNEINNKTNNDNSNNNSNNNNNNTNIIKNNNNSNSNSKLFINSTCGDKEYHSMPHEITERILGTHNEAHEYRSKDNNSDSDSALSSAPPSISPQPPSSAAGLDTADIWQTIKNYSTDFEKVQKDLDILQKENENLQTELNLAKEQILESEKTTFEINNKKKIQQLLERIKYLEQKENKLQKESHELREQNELLEFRILELEESNDKWSSQNNTNPVINKNIWPGTIKETDDVMKIYNDNHIDLDVTSPQHQINDGINSTTPSETLNILEHLTNENLCQRLTTILKKPGLECDDRQCLQMVLQLIQNLDMLSLHGGSRSINGNDSLSTLSGDDDASSLEVLAKSRISDYSSASSVSSARSTLTTPSSDTLQHCPQQTKTKVFPNSNSRIVATVQPYNSGLSPSASTSSVIGPTLIPNDSPLRRTRNAWLSSNLAESGVFEADFFSDCDNSVSTQTDPIDFNINESSSSSSSSHLATKDLCAEIQKLNKFREKIEECVTKNSIKVPVPQSILSTSISDQRRLQFYKERLELLENKILIYESSGDLQTKRLADRLQKEIELEKLVKDLRDRVSFLESENLNLEEEKCEFEEAENDTRLRLQRLEIELEILSQRNIELEISKDALNTKFKDCRSECIQLREIKSQYHTKIYHLEKDNQRIIENFNFLHNILSVLVLYNTYQFAIAVNKHQNLINKMGGTPSKNENEGFSLALQPEKLLSFCRDTDDENTKNNIRETTSKFIRKSQPMSSSNSSNFSPAIITSTPKSTSIPISTPKSTSTPKPTSKSASELHLIQENEKLNQEILKLHDEIQNLRKQISDLNARHYEALECADSHWVEIEKEYKERETTFRAKENNLKQKIIQLQECLTEDSRAATEKIMQLEEIERDLKLCLQKLSKEHRDLLDEHRLILDEYQRTKDEYDEIKDHSLGPAQDAYEREKARNNSLIEEIRFVRKIQSEIETRAKNEIETMHVRLQTLNKEYLQIEVTNSELKEEVCTLEKQIIEMQKHENDCFDKIRCLTDEVRTKDDMCAILEKRLSSIEVNRCIKLRNVQTCDRGCMPSSSMISVQSLAQELNGSPVKRIKRDENNSLSHSYQNIDAEQNNCLEQLTNQEKFLNLTKDVEKLNDNLISNQTENTEKHQKHIDQQEDQDQTRKPKLFVTEITRI